MNKRNILIGIGILAVLLGALGGYIGYICYLLQGTKSPLGWCIEEVKSSNSFEYREIDAYAYSYTDVTIKDDYKPKHSFKAYMVDFYYADLEGDYYQKWLCAIEYKSSMFSRYVRWNDIYDLDAELIYEVEL